jgi:hypothetical protein
MSAAHITPIIIPNTIGLLLDCNFNQSIIPVLAAAIGIFNQ